MSDFLSSNRTFKVLEKSIGIAARRHRMITNNIANMDTIDYAPRDLDFKAALKAALGNLSGGLIRTHPNHLSTSPATDWGGVLKGHVREHDENMPGIDPVDIDTEMTNLVENNLKYRTSVEMLLRKMGSLKRAISEGGR